MISIKLNSSGTWLLELRSLISLNQQSRDIRVICWLTLRLTQIRGLQSPVNYTPDIRCYHFRCDSHSVNTLGSKSKRIDNVPTTGALCLASRFTSTCPIADDHMPFFDCCSTERTRSAHNSPRFGYHTSKIPTDHC